MAYEVIDPYSGSQQVTPSPLIEPMLPWTLREEPPNPFLFPLAIAGFYHMNLGPVEEAGYAETDNKLNEKIVEEDYIPTLSMFAKYPFPRILSEASGNTWLFLAKEYPAVIDLVRDLRRREIFIPVLGTYTNPLPIITRPDMYRHQVQESAAVEQDLFGDLGIPAEIKFDQEYFYTRGMMGVHDAHQIKALVAWSEHVASYLPLPLQQWYNQGGFINPRWIRHSKGPTFVTPISGPYIDVMRQMAHLHPQDAAPYLKFLESFTKFNVNGNGIFIFGPGDAEYNGYCTPLECGRVITPEWWESFFALVAESPLLYFENPLTLLKQGNVYPLVDLGDGGSRDTSAVWTRSLWSQHIIEKSNVALAALDKLAICIAKTNDPNEKINLSRIYLLALQHYDYSITSDALGYNPIDERRNSAYTHAEACIALCEPVLQHMTTVWQADWRDETKALTHPIDLSR